MKSTNYDIIIIGGGAAGMSAAIYAARGGMKTLLLEKLALGGQANITYEVDNYPGMSDNPSGEDLSRRIEEHARKFGAEFKSEAVKSIENASGEVKTVITRRNAYTTKAIIFATGATPKKLGIPGEAEFTGAGVSYCATCDGAFFRNRTVAVVGGGDVALEDAIYLARTCEKVYLLHRRDELRGARVLQEELKALPNVEILYSHVVEEIVGEDAVEHIRIKNLKTDATSELPVAGVFVAVGIRPGTELVRDMVECDEGGYVIAGEDCATNVPGLYVAGDVRKKPIRQIITAVADGANAAVAVGNYCKL